MTFAGDNIDATCSADDAARRLWDVVVVGAGPAGSLAARLLARSGLAVLLVDRASFPRHKVCGCCLNGAAIDILQRAGLEELPKRLGARTIDGMLLADGRRQCEIKIHQGQVLSREALDAELVREAIRCGADFLPRTSAILERTAGDLPSLRLTSPGCDSASVETKIVIAADGLRGGLLQGDPRFKQVDRRDSRIGVGAAGDFDGEGYPPGKIFMAVSRHGYAGIVRLEDNRIDVAAALDATFVKNYGMADAVEHVIHEAGFPALRGFSAHWHGTPRLTHRLRSVAADRVFVIGDAAGYEEPFTGEGIAWALASAYYLTPIAVEAATDYRPALDTAWQHLRRRLLHRRMAVCRGVSRVLRHPRWTQTATAILARAPALAGPVARYVGGPLHL